MLKAIISKNYTKLKNKIHSPKIIRHYIKKSKVFFCKFILQEVFKLF